MARLRAAAALLCNAGSLRSIHCVWARSDSLFAAGPRLWPHYGHSRPTARQINMSSPHACNNNHPDSPGDNHQKPSAKTTVPTAAANPDREQSLARIYFDKFKQALPQKCTDPDLTRTTPAIIEDRGYTCETIKVTSADGYILTLHRIVSPHTKGGYPVLINHGIFSSSRDFVINSYGGNVSEPVNDNNVGNNLGFELAKRGYDVWLNNSRGNCYSRQHLTLDPKEKKFWEFSFDQMIDYDQPAIIDTMIKTTNYETIAILGHSQGCLITLCLMATQPKYNQLIKPFIALSPVTFVGNIKSPIRHLAHSTLLLKVFKRIGGQFLPSASVIKLIAAHTNLIPDGVWTRNFSLLFGYNDLNMKRFPVFAAGSGLVAGLSTRNLLHLAQCVRAGRLRRYDFESLEENIQHYNASAPPDYPLQNITCKHIALIWACDDWLCDPKDVDKLRAKLTVPLMEDYMVPNEKFNHIDFMFGREVGRLVYRKVIDILKKETKRIEPSHQ